MTCMESEGSLVIHCSLIAWAGEVWSIWELHVWPGCLPWRTLAATKCLWPVLDLLLRVQLCISRTGWLNHSSDHDRILSHTAMWRKSIIGQSPGLGPSCPAHPCCLAVVQVAFLQPLSLPPCLLVSDAVANSNWNLLANVTINYNVMHASALVCIIWSTHGAMKLVIYGCAFEDGMDLQHWSMTGITIDKNMDCSNGIASDCLHGHRMVHLEEF